MKLTAEGIAVIEGDNYLSAQIIAEKRLDVSKEFLEQFRQYIPAGGVVIDVGACLGSYSATFSEMVGEDGWVVCFEANPALSECLDWNLRNCRNLDIQSHGLGAIGFLTGRMEIDSNNIGASRVVPDITGELDLETLDEALEDYFTKVDFIKIDAEGWEPLILDGGAEVINSFRPVMLIEVNTWPLGKMGFTPEDIYSRLDKLDYKFDRFDGPYADILCIPKERT